MEQQKIQLKGAPKKELPTLGVTQKVEGKEKLYIIREPVAIGRIYNVVCPDCGFTIAKKVQAAGVRKHICPKCKTIIGFRAEGTAVVDGAQDNVKDRPEAFVNVKPVKTLTKEPAEKAADKPADKPEEKSPEKPEEKKPTEKFYRDSIISGEIVWGGVLSPKHHTIGTMPVTIGRKDRNEPSEISLNDDYVSRQSAVIEPIRNESGFLYKFTVLRASNPVFVNGRELLVGNSIYLNYGDTIKLGKTTLTFKKAKK